MNTIRIIIDIFRRERCVLGLYTNKYAISLASRKSVQHLQFFLRVFCLFCVSKKKKTKKLLKSIFIGRSDINLYVVK